MSNCGCHSGWRANSAGCCVVSLSTTIDSLPDWIANTVWPGVCPNAGIVVTPPATSTPGR